jgi:hypothetical protein
LFQTAPDIIHMASYHMYHNIPVEQSVQFP